MILLEDMGFSKGKLIRIISIEDLIVDRLNACKHWKSQYDFEQAQVLAGAYLNKLDMELYPVFGRNGTSQSINEFMLPV